LITHGCGPFKNLGGLALLFGLTLSAEREKETYEQNSAHPTGQRKRKSPMFEHFISPVRRDKPAGCIE